MFESTNKLKALIWIAVSTEAQTNDDKDSLDKQKVDAISFCQQSDYEIIEILEVAGHSRRYLDFNLLIKDSLRKNPPVTAFKRLKEHIDSATFDILVVRDGDRFARTQSLHAFVTESVIDSGANIYSLADGMVDKHNYRMWTAMSGYKSASEVDSLKKKRKFGMRKRAELGLHTGSSTTASHMEVRNDVGKAIALIPDPDRYQEMVRGVKLLLRQATTLRGLSEYMFDLYGYGSIRDGETVAYSVSYYYRVFTHPNFWGHTGFNYSKANGAFRIERGHPLPDDATMYYDSIEPAIKDPLLAEFKSYMMILALARGKSKDINRRRTYTGLVRCQGCGYSRGYDVNTAHGKRVPFLRCRDRAKRNCPVSTILRIKTVDEWVHHALVAFIDGDDSVWFGDSQGPDIDMDSLYKEINRVSAKMVNLIDQSADFEGRALDAFKSQINSLANQIDKLETEKRIQEDRLYLANEYKSQFADSIESLKSMTLNGYYNLQESEKNMLLHRLFGGRRIVTLGNEVLGITKLDD